MSNNAMITSKNSARLTSSQSRINSRLGSSGPTPASLPSRTVAGRPQMTTTSGLRTWSSRRIWTGWRIRSSDDVISLIFTMEWDGIVKGSVERLVWLVGIDRGEGFRTSDYWGFGDHDQTLHARRLFYDLLLKGVQVLELEFRRLDSGFWGWIDFVFFEWKLKVFGIEGERRKLFVIELAEVDIGLVFIVIFWKVRLVWAFRLSEQDGVDFVSYLVIELLWGFFRLIGAEKKR